MEDRNNIFYLVSFKVAAEYTFCLWTIWSLPHLVLSIRNCSADACQTHLNQRIIT